MTFAAYFEDKEGQDSTPNGKAARQGLQRGDILVRADRKPVNHPNDLKKALQEAKKQGRSSLPVLIRRGDVQQFSTLPVA